MDRGYLDFARLYHIHQCQAWFVTRSKKNTQYQRVYSKKVDKSKGILCDQKVRLTGTNAMKDYPELIRRINPDISHVYLSGRLLLGLAFYD